MLSSSNIIYSIIDNSLEIYDGLVKKTLDINILYEVLKSKKDFNKLNINEITQIKRKRMLNKYKKIDFIDEILSLNENKYKYLKDVRYLINLDELVDYVIIDDIFIEKIKLKYTSMIIDLLVIKFYDRENIKLLGKNKENIYLIERRLNNKIIKRLKQYYVKKITV